jgi:hypothetical protein
MSQAERR